MVCVISGGNNDIGRMQEIKEKSLIYEGLVGIELRNSEEREGLIERMNQFVCSLTK